MMEDAVLSLGSNFHFIAYGQIKLASGARQSKLKYK